MQNQQVQYETTVLIAVGHGRVREALAAMFNAREGFRVVAEVDSATAAITAARVLRPDVAVIEPALSEYAGLWALQQIRADGGAGVLVALGRRTDNALATALGVDLHLEMGTSPRDLLSALDRVLNAGLAARAPSAAQAEGHALADANPVV
ncbi:MAG: hypothetical protein NVSMB2_26850 [Chloroflexota bacterium]